jgi:hypothetical protein
VALLNAVLIGGLLALGALCAMVLVERAGRRPLLLWGAGTMAVLQVGRGKGGRAYVKEEGGGGTAVDHFSFSFAGTRCLITHSAAGERMRALLQVVVGAMLGSWFAGGALTPGQASSVLAAVCL